MATAPGFPVYRLEMAANDGPADLALKSWQPVQFDRLISATPSASGAGCGGASASGAYEARNTTAFDGISPNFVDLPS